MTEWEYRGGAWRLVDLRRDDVRGLDRVRVDYTDAAKANILNRASRGDALAT